MEFIVFLFFCSLMTVQGVPADLENYDLIIIPVPKGRLQTNYITEKRERKHPRKKNYYRKGDFERLDVEHYEEPTELPDVDNFDYNIGREDVNKRSTRDGEDQYDVESNYGDDKIVGGAEVDINSYPYHVAYGSNCGGAIIDKKWIITAGHCGKKPYIRAGSKYLNQGQKISVKRSIIHPLWSAKSKEHPFDFDYQLLELSEPLTYNDNVQPIKIARTEDMVIGKVISVTGWGNTEENGPYSDVLRAVRVPIVSKENCQSVPFPYFRGSLTARMFCAGYTEGKKDACQGDSGGPAVSNDRLLGIISFGYGCATPGSFGVYSKVAKVRDWIESNTGLRLD